MLLVRSGQSSKIKYLTSIMCGHAKSQVVVTDMLMALENVAILKLMLNLRMDGPNENKFILNKLSQTTRRKAFHR